MPSAKTSRPLHAALCLLLAISLVALMAPLPGAGAPAAVAAQDENPAPAPQDAPSPELDDPNDDPAPDPAAEPTNDPAVVPAADPVEDPPVVVADDLAAGNGPEVGGPADWALDKVYGIAFSLVEGAAFKALNEAVDPEYNEELNTVLDFIDGLLGGSNSIEHECDKILQAVNELSAQITDLENGIDQQFNALEQTITLNQIESQRSEIVKMSDSVYALALDAYQAFIDASKAYSESIGTTNEQARLLEAQAKEQVLVDAFAKLDYERDLETIETHGINMGNYTYQRYLYNLNKYADETFAFDHQRYALLTAGINDVVVNLNVVVYVQRLEYDYWKAKDSTSPASLLVRETKLVNNLNRVVRDVNHTVGEYSNKDSLDSWPRPDLLTLMRPYDFQTEYDFDYASSSNRSFKFKVPPGAYSRDPETWHYTAKAVKTAPTMPAYRGAVGGTTFLVLDGSLGLSHGAKNGDLIHGLRYWEKTRHSMLLTHEYFGFPDQDFFSLLSTKDGVYSLPADFSPLSPLISMPSYAGSGGSLTRHLGKNGMGSIGSPAYVLMNSYVDPAPYSGARSTSSPPTPTAAGSPSP